MILTLNSSRIHVPEYRKPTATSQRQVAVAEGGVQVPEVRNFISVGTSEFVKFWANDTKFDALALLGRANTAVQK